MPPRKKPRLSSRGASTPAQTESQQPASTTPVAQPEAPGKPDPDHDPVTDPWSDEQETSLLKGVIKWKPVGMHKHFRMLAISEHMKSQGYAASNEEHTRIPGIWKKLGTLYNLQPLDERESYIADPAEDSDPSKELYCPFQLPEEEYGDMMFARRLAPDGSASPPLSMHRGSQRGSTVADTDEILEPRSSPAPARRGRTKRATRPTTRGTRSSKLAEPAKGRQQSDKAASVEEDERMEDAGDEDGEEDGTEAGKDESDGDEEAKSSTGGAPSPTTRGTRAQATRGKKKKGRGGTRRTGRRGG